LASIIRTDCRKSASSSTTKILRRATTSLPRQTADEGLLVGGYFTPSPETSQGPGGYYMAVVNPKVAKFRKRFAEKMKK
jgi:hypothetical protein